MKYEAIEANSSVHSVRKMCRVLGLRHENYCAWKRHRKIHLEKEKERKALGEKVRCVFEENRRLYGYRKMREALAREGILLSEYRIRKIMGRYGMFPETRRKYRPAGSRQSSIYSPDQIRQEFHADKPGKLLAGDITYNRTKLGWVYLASVIDLFNREVIGYSISQNMDGELVKRALGKAIGRKGSLRGAIFHSDRGSQYGSGTCKRMLNPHGIIQSMSRGGCPYDNACSESFFATAKKSVFTGGNMIQ